MLLTADQLVRFASAQRPTHLAKMLMGCSGACPRVLRTGSSRQFWSCRVAETGFVEQKSYMPGRLLMADDVAALRLLVAVDMFWRKAQICVSTEGW